MNDEALRAEILRLGPWHYDIEVAPGIRTGDVASAAQFDPGFGEITLVDPFRVTRMRMSVLYPSGLGGRSMLDCACNSGGLLFAAAQLGAGRGFGFDVREHWINQARFLATQLPGDNLEFDTMELGDLPARGLDPFDITIFSGILYHLPDPIAGLRIAADLTRELLVVNTWMMPARQDALVLKRENTTHFMSGVDGLSWLPGSVRVVRELLRWCGFPHTRLRFNYPEPQGRRIEILAARDSKTFEYYDSVRGPEREERSWLRRLARRFL